MSRAKAVAHQMFSTKSFVPGHVVGAAILVFGTIAVAKAAIARGQAAAREVERSARRSENDRGQYGRNRP